LGIPKNIINYDILKTISKNNMFPNLFKILQVTKWAIVLEIITAVCEHSFTVLSKILADNISLSNNRFENLFKLYTERYLRIIDIVRTLRTKNYRYLYFLLKVNLLN